MQKIKSLCEIVIRLLFCICLLGIIYFNFKFFNLDNSNLFFNSLFLIIIALAIMWLYKKEIVNKSFLYIFIACLIIVGIGIRIYYIENISFNLLSDFKFVYGNAEHILNGTIMNADLSYLSYNGYSYILSLLIAGLFSVFGTSVNVILYANLVCQLLSVYFLYKIISLKHSKETASLLSVAFFLLPSVIFANLLVATETPFFLVFFISIYAFYKIIDRRNLTIKNCVLYSLLGIIFCLTNYIRPVMTIFLIALFIYYILQMKKVKEILLLIPLLLVYEITDFTVNKYIESNIGMETRSGALGWSIYFGSNYEYCGAWSPEDSTYVFEVLEDETKGDSDLILMSLNRFVDMGPKKSVELLACKYASLWTNNVGTFHFVNDIINTEKTDIVLTDNYGALASVSQIFVIFLCGISIFYTYRSQKNNQTNWLFIELFGLGYILSNLLVCLNGRYNLPLYPILLICCAPFVDKFLKREKQTKKKVEISKITNKKPKVLLIIPAYNEQDSIEKTISKVTKENYDYIIINDGSKDLTEQICKENGFNYISLPNNLGIGGAVQTGYRYALENGYDIAIQFDADGQHDVKYVEKIIKPIIENKAHFVIGSRFVVKDDDNFQSTKMRRVGINLISALIKYLSKKRIYDTTSGFRAANIDVIKRFVEYYPTEYPEPISNFELLKHNYVVEEIPVKMHEREAGNSSIVSWKKAYYMINVYISIIIVQIRGDK